jgi:transcriptional activator SPT8
MRDADDAEPEHEPEPEPESPSNDSLVSEGQARNQQNADLLTQGPSPGRISPDPLLSFRPTVRPEALGASTYDIIPTTAAPHSTSINAIAATADMRWVFSGGSDGFIRKFNWVDSMNGKLMLTVAQRHPFVDSVVKAGVLMSYWPNMEGSSLSPVYSLASQAEGLWLLSGLDSGAIRLQSVRHDEGKEIALLRKHASAVSVLRLTSDERSLLSGSWDKTVVDWDLNTGQARRAFSSSVGQVSGIQIRPESTVPVPQETGEPHLTNGLSSSNRLADSSSLGTFNGDDVGQGESGQGQNAASPADSLFGSDSLFGDHDGPGEHEAPSGGAFPVEEDDEFSQALPNGIQHPEAPGQGEPGPPAEGNDTETVQSSTDVGQAPGDSTQDSHRVPGEAPNGISEALANGLPHADELELMSMMGVKQEPTPDAGSGINCDTTFLAASIDGTIRIWDRRQPDPVAKIISRTAPPWCMSACWSPDGNYIYAGRRNGTVEEYSMHKGLRNPERIFKLPPGSGAVSELQAMPNGRHLIWYDGPVHFCA